MHMADALVSTAVAGTMYACTAGVAIHSVRTIDREQDTKKIPIMGVMGAFVFAAQMINFSIPGTGSSGHLSGAMMLTILLGPQAGFLTLLGVLLIQALLFADGGLLVLGANVWNMAFYGCFLGYYCIWKPIMKRGVTRKKIWIGSLLGSVIALQLGAFSVTVMTTLSGITSLPFTAFVTAMQPIHLAIGLVEGGITGAIISFVYEVRPELIKGAPLESKSNLFSFKKTLIIFGIAALFIGGILSYAASSHPDGLEWSIEQLTGETELLEQEGGLHGISGRIQEKCSILPDYGFKNSESVAGTSFAGISGAVMVLLICGGTCHVITRRKGKINE